VQPFKWIALTQYLDVYIPSPTLPLLPAIRLNTNKIRKIKNNILAIPAAPAAIPPKPNMAAIIATTKKIIVQRNITLSFK
jgi:hypothetical protein